MQAAEKPIPTSLKLPPEVKRGIDEAARREGVTPHAFMVNALQQSAERARLRAQFTQDALDAEQDALARGAHDFDDVRAYFAARRRGDNPPQPPLRPLL